MNPTLSILLATVLSLGAADYSIRSIQVLPAGEQTTLNLAVTTEDGFKSVRVPFSEIPAEARGDWATCTIQATNPTNNIVPAGGSIIQVVVEPRGKTSDFNQVISTNELGEVSTSNVAIEGTERMVFDFFWTVSRNGAIKQVKASSETMPRPFQICCESLWNILYTWLNAKPAEAAILP